LIGQVPRTLGIGEQTYYRWQNEYGGLPERYRDLVPHRACSAAEGSGAREQPAEEAGGRPVPGQRYAPGDGLGKLVSPARRRQAAEHLRETFAVSERRACRAPGQSRSSQRYSPQTSEAEQQLTESIVSVATQYGRYGYRRVTTMLQ
jgi:putative transposase